MLNIILITLSIFSFNVFSKEINSSLKAATLEYPPYAYPVLKGEEGLAIDLINEAIKRAGGVTNINYHFYPWSRAVAEVKAGKDDILFNAGKNKSRQQWGYYVDSVLIQQTYVLFKKKETVVAINSDFTNVQKYTVGIRRGYLYGSGKFRKALDGKNFKNAFKTDSTAQSVKMLLAGRTDFFIGDYLPVMYYLQKNNLLDQVEIIKETKTKKNMEVLSWPTYIVFSKKSVSKEFVDKVKSSLDRMKNDGTYDNIFNKYSKCSKDTAIRPKACLFKIEF